MSDAPLLDWQPRYPEVPGHRNVDTSIAAAEAVKDKVARLQGLCLSTIRALGPKTADEIAAHVHEDKGSIRPRCTELKRKGLLFDSGARRPNKSGRNAIVWKVKA